MTACKLSGENWNSAPEPRTANPHTVKEVLSEIRLIPWQEIWRALFVAKLRGSSKITEIFLNSLFAEAVFDDQGAWSRVERKSSCC